MGSSFFFFFDFFLYLRMHQIASDRIYQLINLLSRLRSCQHSLPHSSGTFLIFCIHLKDSPSRIAKHVGPRLHPRHSNTSLHATSVTHNPSVITHHPEHQYLHPLQQQPPPPPLLQRATRGHPGNHVTSSASAHHTLYTTDTRTEKIL